LENREAELIGLCFQKRLHVADKRLSGLKQKGFESGPKPCQLRAYQIALDKQIATKLYIKPIAERLSMSEFSNHAVLLKALADPRRRALFERLCRSGEQCVGPLTSDAGISQPAVSKHLGILQGAGLVSGRIHGRQTFYRAHPAALAPLRDWTHQMASFWECHVDKLEDLLNRMDQ
jgi:DNA-binding transcriptional ArsR family regulator